jgi:hypothetical protein
MSRRDNRLDNAPVESFFPGNTSIESEVRSPKLANGRKNSALIEESSAITSFSSYLRELWSLDSTVKFCVESLSQQSHSHGHEERPR